MCAELSESLGRKFNRFAELELEEKLKQSERIAEQIFKNEGEFYIFAKKKIEGMQNYSDLNSFLSDCGILAVSASRNISYLLDLAKEKIEELEEPKGDEVVDEAGVYLYLYNRP